MEKIICMILSAIGLFSPQLTQAQGTVYMSNLDQSSAGSVALGNDAWIAASFYSGNASGGYVLNSVQLLMNQASGSPSGFSVFLYSGIVRDPGGSLGSLSGSDPAAGGIFTYTASGLSLSPFTLYFIVLTATTPVAVGSYDWSFANIGSYNRIDQWSDFSLAYNSSDGSSWTRHDHPFQFAVNATAVPEPATYALVGLGLVCLSYWRRKEKKRAV